MRTEAIFLRACVKLRSAIGDEAEVRLNFAGDLREMLGELEVILPGLEEAEMRIWTGDTSSLLMNWLKDATQAAYRVMDMVDELQETRPPAVATMTRMLPRLAIKKNDMAKKVNEIKNQVIWLKEYWCSYICGEESTIPQRLQVKDERTTVPCFQEASVTGRGSDKQRIVAVLLSAASNITQGPPGCIILPIFGLAGSGKTTLAKMIFNDTSSFLQEYHIRVWVHVSPKFDFHRICEHIISQVVSGGGELEEIDHGSDSGRYLMRLDGLLNGKKVLLVLDDLWEQDSIQLHLLKSMLTSLGNKVDVIVTTCNRAIARKICTVEPYRLSPLDDEACWEIIKKSICLRKDDEELEKIGREIARKCCGVPSVAGAYARMLRSRDPTRWEEVRERNIWRCSGVDSTSQLLLSTFGLSYKSMPLELRLCFDYYCAIFPNGHNIVKDDLIRQWTTLHLIEPSEILSPTQIAEVYITRLLDMSFLQTAKSDPARGEDNKGAILFTMHRLAHNFARWFTLLEYNYDDNIPTRRVHYRLITSCHRDLFDLDDDYLRALRCVGCSQVKFNDESFSFRRCLRVLELTESSVQKLPDSIWQLRHLGYLKISEFSGLVSLPESFGHLNNLFHIDLSSCSGLINLPESFGKLIRLVHVNLSGCSGLATLPESFGDLINLSYLNLSRCYALEEIPVLLQKLGKLVHLDLSFWSCFEGIGKGLGGLVNLEYLNLSHPCCHLPQHRYHLQELKEGLCKLTSLRYLNLSMCLNPIFYYPQSQEDSLHYIGDCLRGLSSLEHLDLSHNTFLFGLPESIGHLNKLHTLNLSGCIRLKKIGEIKSLKFISQRNCRDLESCYFVVHVDDDAPYSSSNIDQLEDVNCQELQICCLENVMSLEEAQRIRLVEKQKLERLKLSWSVGDARGSVKVDENALLGELVPPHSLHCLEFRGYGGEIFLPSWRIPSISSHLSNLVEVTMEDFPRCTTLPPLGLLPNLERLVLRRMASIARIDDIDLSSGNQAAFSRISKVTIDDMENLKVFLFAGVAELIIQKCPELSFGPLLPKAQRLVISDCNKVMSSCWNRGGDCEEESTSSTPVTELVVENCNLPLGHWSLLHHLPGLHNLTINNCGDLLTSSPEIIQALSSLRSLCFSHCEGMISLPEYFGELTSLRKLTIQSCRGMECLLQNMDKVTNLKDLYILDCPSLKKWCESEENEVELAHIRPKYEKVGARSTV